MEKKIGERCTADEARADVMRELMAAGWPRDRASMVTDLAMLAVEEATKKLEEVTRRLANADDQLQAYMLAIELTADRMNAVLPSIALVAAKISEAAPR